MGSEENRELGSVTMVSHMQVPTQEKEKAFTEGKGSWRASSSGRRVHGFPFTESDQERSVSSPCWPLLQSQAMRALSSHLLTLFSRGLWKAAVHGVAEGWTQLSDFTFTFHFHALEKEMAIHSSVRAWRIPGMGEPSGLPSMGSHRVRHD